VSTEPSFSDSSYQSTKNLTEKHWCCLHARSRVFFGTKTVFFLSDPAVYLAHGEVLHFLCLPSRFSPIEAA
jgi:hypothetical protein